MHQQFVCFKEEKTLNGKEVNYYNEKTTTLNIYPNGIIAFDSSLQEFYEDQKPPLLIYLLYMTLKTCHILPTTQATQKKELVHE